MKVRDYLMLVKWLDKSGDDRLIDFGIFPDYGDFYQGPPIIGGRWGRSASEIVLCDADYSYVLDWHVVRDQWDISSTTLEPFSGTGGNNQPLVLDHTAYRICSEKSNGFLSDNPHVGIYEADVSPTLDTSDQSPNKSQGGIVVLEGNGCRPSHKGDGYKESEVMYTLNTIERHGVAYGLGRDTFNCGQNASFSLSMDEEIQPTMTSRGPGAVAHSDDECYTLSKASRFTVAFKDAVAPTLMASDYKDAVAVSYAPHYIVRKLTPVECARLQGFPDWWCSDLETDSADVTEEELAFWRCVFETHRQLVTHSAKAKTDRQILKWLESPHTDAAEYKMWGNGVALPCVQWIMQQIVRVVEDSDD